MEEKYSRELVLTAEEVMRRLNNRFELYRYEGGFSVRNGRLPLPAAEPEESWIWISGSRFSDGLHLLYGLAELERDETFEGSVAVLAPPRAFLDLCRRIAEYKKRAEGMLKSEHFGDYGYSLATGADGTLPGWQSAFAAELALWRLGGAAEW